MMRHGWAAGMAPAVPLVVMILVPSSALAYVCLEIEDDGCTECNIVVNDSEFTYRIESSLTTAQKDAIELGFEAWRAGANQIVRGASFAFNRGSDVTTGGFSNSRNEVFARDENWWNDHFIDEADDLGNVFNSVAITRRRSASCLLYEFDTVLHQEMLPQVGTDPILYSNKIPSANNEPAIPGLENYSIPQVIVHEAGHVYGLGHNNVDNPNIMQPYPSGGELGGEIRIHEDQYAALRDFHGDASTGNNVSLTKYQFSGDMDGGLTLTEEGFPSPTARSASKGTTMSGALSGEWHVYLETMSTSTLTDVDVRWGLSLDTDCDDNDQIQVAIQRWTLSVNGPTKASPSGLVIPLNMASGYYQMCVWVDGDGDIAETSDTDNTLRFQGQFHVHL